MDDVKPAARARERRRRYTTGVADLDERVAELVRAVESDEREAELVTQIMTTGLLLARDGASRLDMKIINAALKEMRYAFKVFAPYRDTRKVSVFGSARTVPGHPDYDQAVLFGKTIAERGWMVVTGAGPGTMQGANEGAGKAASFGVNIRLPFEAEPNPFIAADPKLINFKYFFTRKLMFIKEGSAFVLLPGGFGTMDEAFELLTLIQTGKSDVHPVVLLDRPGGRYWKDWLEFIERDLIEPGYVSGTDLSLFTLTDDAEVAADELVRFYSNYDSMRFIGDNLVLRVQRAPDDATLQALSEEFADILLSGGLRITEPSRAEEKDGEAIGLPRIAMRFDRANYGRLRALVDRLNGL